MKPSKDYLILASLGFVAGLLIIGYNTFNKKSSESPNEQNSPIEIESVKLASPTPVVEEIVPDVPEDPATVETFIFVSEQDDITAFDLLQRNAQINYKMYDFGFFVEDINGIKSSPDYFWALYVNGVKAEKGADQIRLKVGDKMEWKYEKIEM